MKQRTNTTKRKRANTLLTVIMILMVASITGCSKKPAPVVEESKPSTQATVETIKPTEEVLASSEAEVTPEPTVEAPEPTVEPIVYEGIDMESDLPFEEWVQTFIGVVDEPVVFIYNDSTGRKEIVQEGSSIHVNPDEDMMGIYYPDENMKSTAQGLATENTINYGNYKISGFNSELVRKVPEIMAQMIVKDKNTDVEVWKLNFTVIVE